MNVNILHNSTEVKNCTGYECRQLGVFFTEEYLRHMSKKNDQYLYLVSLKYIMPVIVRKKSIFVYAMIQYQPIVYKNDVGEKEKQFLNKAVLILKKQFKIQWINPVPAYTTFLEYPERSEKIPFGNYILNLTQSEEFILKNIHSKHRNCIKKAEKDGVIVKHGKSEKLLEDYLIIDEQTWKRSKARGLGFPYYKSIIVDSPNIAEIFISYYEKIPQAGAIFLYDNIYCYYMYGASADNPHSGAGNLLHWEAIKWMKLKSIEKYCLVGCRINVDENSKYYGIQRFKERFGGELVKGYMFKIVINHFMYIIFRILLSIKNRKVVNDAIDQEKKKWITIIGSK